jgi:hypothetical protein
MADAPPFRRHDIVRVTDSRHRYHRHLGEVYDTFDAGHGVSVLFGVEGEPLPPEQFELVHRPKPPPFTLGDLLGRMVRSVRHESDRLTLGLGNEEYLEVQATEPFSIYFLRVGESARRVV